MVTTSPFYKPLESPPRYPLELRFSDTNDMLEVLLWAENDRTAGLLHGGDGTKKGRNCTSMEIDRWMLG